jgi:hypothetical protein
MSASLHWNDSLSLPVQDVVPKLMGLSEAHASWRRHRFVVEQQPLRPSITRKQCAVETLDVGCLHLSDRIGPAEDAGSLHRERRNHPPESDPHRVLR